MISRSSFRAAVIPFYLHFPKPSERLIRILAQNVFQKPVATSFTRTLFSNSFKKPKVEERFESEDAFFENNLKNPNIRVIDSTLHYEIKHSDSDKKARPSIISVTSREGKPIELSSKEVHSLLGLPVVKKALKGITEDEVRTLYIHPKLFSSLNLRSLIVLKLRGAEIASSSDSSSVVEDYYIYSTIFQSDPFGINPFVPKDTSSIQMEEIKTSETLRDLSSMNNSMTFGSSDSVGDSGDD